MKHQDSSTETTPVVPDLSVFITAKEQELLPCYATAGAAGADVRAYISHAVTIDPLRHRLIPTGLSVALPMGYEIQVRSRSGLALKHGIMVLNSPGTIDADYRGEIGVILMNMGQDPFVVEPGMRIAQIVLAAVARAEFVVTDKLPGHSARADGGFGHTGLH